MGWKASSIIISPRPDITYEEFLHKLDFPQLTKIEDEPFEIAINPDQDTIFIGTFKDNLIISIDEIPLQFFAEGLSAFEEKLITLFPNTEICAVSLHSAVNHWGFAVIKNGKKIRAKAGDADSGTVIDFGEPLEEEKELLSKSTINSEGKRTYLLDSFPKEPFSEDQVGENIVFDIFKRYTGTSLNSDDELLFESSFTGYQISKPVKTQAVEKSQSIIERTAKKPWWKIW